MTAPTPDAGQWVWHSPVRSPLDRLSSDLDRKWGVNRLIHLAAPDLRARFMGAHDLRNGEYEFATEERRQSLDAMMERAWLALERAAIAAGHEPLPPAIYEAPLDPDDPAFGVLALCLDDEHAQVVRLRANAEERNVKTWTMAEMALFVQRSEMVNAIKHEFPGATVRTQRPRRIELPEDDIPFGGPVLDEAEVPTEAAP